MPTHDNPNKPNANGSGFIGYALPRLVLAIMLIVAIISGACVLLNHLDLVPARPAHMAEEQHDAIVNAPEILAEKNQTAALTHTEANDTEKVYDNPSALEAETTAAKVEPLTEVKPDTLPVATRSAPSAEAQPKPLPPEKHAGNVTDTPAAQPITQQEHVAAPHPAVPPPDDSTHSSPAPTQSHTATPSVAPQPVPHATEGNHASRATGVAFVEAMVQSIEGELSHRFWGWRPNDVLNLTDNVNNMQLGVLEVTRRTAVQLAERISRTGSTDAFNAHLENAMNWFMVKADRYWFPAPESKYKESLRELEAYKKSIINGTASFHTRTDNLIPLLMAYEDLLGSCDENLVKSEEKDGSKVSMFKADDYFYYAKGVAGTMATMLSAIHHDFAQTLENRNGSGLLHHAITSCRTAADLDPWFVTNSNLDGIFANHRANMAAPISHARFFIGQLIKTLST